jgi:hypothetical protein
LPPHMRFELIVHWRCHASVMGWSQNHQLCGVCYKVLTFAEALHRDGLGFTPVVCCPNQTDSVLFRNSKGEPL